jgi:hypothetical protein
MIELLPNTYSAIRYIINAIQSQGGPIICPGLNTVLWRVTFWQISTDIIVCCFFLLSDKCFNPDLQKDECGGRG